MNRREWVLRSFRDEYAEKVPAGFWFHFVQDELEDGFANPRVFEKNLAGHRAYYGEFQPDFMKIMTDGFFIYPNTELRNARNAGDLLKVVSIGEDHPWIEKQIEFAKAVTGIFGGEVLSFYNIFAPATTFKFMRRDPLRDGDAELAAFITEDRDAVKHALAVTAEDLAVLARRVILEGGADGIYFSTQDINGQGMTRDIHDGIIAPGDTLVLEAANAAAVDAVHAEAAVNAAAAGGPGGGDPARTGPLNILHICGYEGHRNDLGRFVSYPAQIFNWASAIEGVPLGEGKRLFGKPVIGGFANTADGILCRGSESDVKAETRRILEEAGRKGVVLGADCTIPRDTDLRRLDWVREAASSPFFV
ncbi:MAG: uroporphyrinogen decarboxylase [Treponema sp.]|jgi:uroporphyrinogen decarboxylase|nr:uroporphyrinogen decarboxylase [Treponema sp.]